MGEGRGPQAAAVAAGSERPLGMAEGGEEQGRRGTEEQREIRQRAAKLGRGEDPSGGQHGRDR
eukprot:3606986-Alexandrium_andersonii.AAC.1